MNKILVIGSLLSSIVVANETDNVPAGRGNLIRVLRERTDGVNLNGADLRGELLFCAHLKAALLRGANLTRAYLVGADLTDADLTGANLRGANLRGARLHSADLTDVDVRGADLVGADFRGANLSAATVGPDFDRVDFTDVKLNTETKIERRWAHHFFLANTCTLPNGTRSKNCSKDLKMIIAAMKVKKEKATS